LEEGLQSHARENGYAITVQRSNKKDGSIYYHCDRSGVYKAHHGRNETNRLRDTGSRLTDCPFSIHANLKDSIWTIKVRNSNHNHEPTSPVAHPIHRRPPPEVIKQVTDLTASGAAPKEIISAVWLSTDHPILSKNIYNIRMDVKATNLAGKTPMEALIEQLSNSNFISE
jgi:malonate-semialdehyde dehydrogenase (acetylating) / methylmalonate-semialdehyde dehydrogenase